MSDGGNQTTGLLVVWLLSSLIDGCNLCTLACRLAAGHYFIPTIVQLRWSSFFTRVERLNVLCYLFKASIVCSPTLLREHVALSYVSFVHAAVQRCLTKPRGRASGFHVDGALWAKLC
uniref:Putative secreted protein n=1 Tax=Ixodes ricinus TaxID=34613 RepID=A0A6B0UMH9_IXORI